MRKSTAKPTAKLATKAAKKTESKKVPTQKVVAKATPLDLILKKSGPINFRVVHDAWEYMQEVGIEEFEYRTPKFEVKLRAGGGVAPSAPAPRVPLEIHHAQESKPVSASSLAATTTPSVRTNVHVVTCPFVGTFYRSPGPNEESFVSEGKTVRTGDVLCIVEAMKLMNEIESDASGKITRILVENGTAVEFGEPLFEIEKV